MSVQGSGGDDWVISVVGLEIYNDMWFIACVYVGSMFCCLIEGGIALSAYSIYGIMNRGNARVSPIYE